MVLIPLSQIDDNPFQTRTGYDPAGIEELARDIALNGLLQPPVGRIVGEDGAVLDPEEHDAIQAACFPDSLATLIGKLPKARVQLAFGHRRLRAMRWLAEQPECTLDSPYMALELRMLNDEQMAMQAWSENAKRKDLTPVEEAQAIARMGKDFGWTQDQVAEKLGLSRPTVSNKLRLLKLPAAVLQQVQAGELSERQAAALLPMYELPQACLNAYERESNYFTKAKDVLKNAPGSSSDYLRREVEQVVERATLPLNVPWAGHAFDDQHVKAATCEGCELRIRRNGDWRCASKSCHERKSGLWSAERLAAATAATGIPAAPDEMEWAGYAPLTKVPNPDKVIAKGCENLRLRWTGDDRNQVTRVRLADYQDVEVICLHGKGGRCTCGSAAKAAATRADPDIQAQKAAERRIQEELIDPSVAAVLAGLLEGDRGVWLALTGKMWGVSAAHDDGLPTLQRKIASALADTTTYTLRDKTDFGQWKEAREERLRAMGLPIPWATTEIEKLQRRYKRIAEWVTGRAWWRFDHELNVEAIAGNIANLDTLINEIVTLIEQGDDGATGLLTEAQESLNILRAVAVMAPAVNSSRMSGYKYHNLQVSEQLISTAEPGSLEFAEALALATEPLLEYAFALAVGMDRIQAINGRLMELRAEEEVARSETGHSERGETVTDAKKLLGAERA